MIRCLLKQLNLCETANRFRPRSIREVYVVQSHLLEGLLYPEN